MSPEAQTVCVAAVMFFAALTRSTFGFGEALVAMPLLALLLKVETATPLVAINSIFNSVVILATSRDSTDWRGGLRLSAASLVGIPVGVYILTHVAEFAVKGLLAAVMIFFSVYSLRRPTGWRLANDNWAFPFGFVGGILGGAYNTSGPALVIFGSLRGWSPSQFRSTLQGVFLPNAICILAMHYSAGLWSSDVLRFLLWSLPFILITVPIGYWINRRFHPEHFQRALYVMLLLLAMLLLASAVRG